MNTRKIWIAALASILIGTSMITVSGASGSSRLPWSDNEELLRLLVMGPGVQAPSKEYIIQASEAIDETYNLELESFGIEVVSVRGESAIVSGPLTAFSELSGAGLPWIRSVLPNLPVDHYAGGQQFYFVEMEEVLSACRVQQLQSVEAQDDALIGVIDTGFTGYLAEQLGADRVHYVSVISTSSTGVGSARFVLGRNENAGEGDHGTACAEAIAAIVPNAEFILFSAPSPLDRLNTVGLIGDGGEINVGGHVIDLSDLDVISDSTYCPQPFDHNDGEGLLAQLADRVVASGIPYVQALGNSAEGEATSSSFYAAEFEDSNGDLWHDFNPLASSAGDANSLALELDMWAGHEMAYVRVILEWDGWPYQLRPSASRPWTQEEIERIQDLDLLVYYEDPETLRVNLVIKAVENQFRSLLEDGPLYPLPPVEIVEFMTDKPGTYFLIVENYTPKQRADVLERSVDFHLYVETGGASFNLEHHTPEGAFRNVGGAKDVLSVGAVGTVAPDSWCLMPYSSRGPTSDGRLKPEVAAPTLYASTYPKGYFGGTSAAAPVVAGIVALLRNAIPEATPQLLREAFRQAAQQLPGACNDVPGPVSDTACSDGCNYGVGWGMVDAWEAYLYLKDATN
ncbi:S8 family serine peptidase [Candidatus Bipolaricaulota bacterium]